jgi:hypothetical protein
VALNTRTLSSILARDLTVSEYDLWRAQRGIEDELYRRRRLGAPVPIELVYARRIVDAAWTQRYGPRD